ncbi:DUF2802 domain-containing protein [Oceanobacter kriegii]|uniref:DUF2802 domain-containing protein n=1 Tax=Oceanobacter kriegii TaxID=64972 RepID=UPI000423E29C|nr:DUF2802 domain-containing protein [Oceanobacter kriegii]
MWPLSIEQGVLLVVAGVLVVGLVTIKRLRGAIVKLEKQSLSQQHKLSQLKQNQEAMNQSVVGMGRKIRQLTERLGEAEQRSLFTPGDEASYQQAARLVSLGASARELVENCGMARAEAELLVSLKGGRPH